MRLSRSTLLVMVLGAVLLGCPATSTPDGGSISAPAGLAYTPSALVCHVGASCAVLGPSNTGGAVATFGVTPALPTGLALDSTSGAIAGVPTIAAPKGDYVVTGTNAGGNASVIMSITVLDVEPSALAYSSSPAIYEKGTPIAPNTPTVKGLVTAWAITPSLPSGLSFNSATGVITGSPTVVKAAATYTVTASNSGGSTTAALEVTVNDQKPSALAYASNPASYTQGQAIAANLPSNQGGAVVSYAVQPALPAGLSLDTSTGAITGTPTMLSPAATYVVTATNSGGSSSVSLSLAVVAVPPSALLYATNPANYTQGVAITPNLPMVGGGTVISYSVMPSLPAGLSLDPTSGVISGTPTTLAGVGMYTVTATNSGGSTAVTLVLAVRPPAPVVTSPASQAVQNGTRAQFTVTATGTGPLTYEWRRGGTALGGATSVTYTTTPVAVADSGAQIAVAVSDSYGNTTLSAPATLTVLPGTFTGTGAMSKGRAMASAVLLNDGQVLVVGGQSATGVVTLAERFNPATGQFTALSNTLAAPRTGPAVVLLPSGKVLIAGGYDGSGTLASAEIFDPSSNAFTPTANAMSNNRRYLRQPGAFLLKTGKVLVLNGQDFSLSIPSFAWLKSADLYDPVSNQFTATGSMASSHVNPCIAQLQDGRVLVAGGDSPPTAELYDPATGTFGVTSGAPLSRAGSVCTVLKNGKVLITGGTNGSTPVLAAELFDPSTGKFTAMIGALSLDRTNGTATLLPSGNVLIVGGPEGPTTIPPNAELYDPLSDAFVSTPNLGVGRSFATVTVLPSGKVLIAGGETYSPGLTFEKSAELYW